MIIRAVALCSNLLYAAGALMGLAVLAGLGDSPWRAYANVVGFVVVAGMAAVLNVRVLRSKRWSVLSTPAIVLNLAALGYMLVRPEYAHALVKSTAAAVPVLNIAVLTVDGIRATRAGT